jgi:polysaccharide export outer membrane protein
MSGWSLTGPRGRLDNRSMRPFAFLLSLTLAACPVIGLADDDYEIGPGDVLRIAVMGQAAMSGDFAVDSEGMLPFPVLGKIKASEHSTKDLERKLTTLLADGYIKRPQVTVTVQEYKSQRVFVTGEVARPGPYALRSDRSLLSFLGDLGPMSPNAGHEVVVIRPPLGARSAPVPLLTGATPEGGTPLAGAPLDIPDAEVFRVSLQELQSGNPDRNILLQPGDTVYVPKAAQIYITGSVARPGPYRFQEGTTLMQALIAAGGVTERGSAKRAKVLRIVGGKRVEVKLKPEDYVQPEDTIVVPERFF